MSADQLARERAHGPNRRPTNAPPPSPDPMVPLVLINHLVEPPGRITGITRYAFGLISALVRRNDVRVMLASAWRRDELPADIAAGVEDVITLPHIASTPLNYWRMRQALDEIVRRHSVDVVYAMNPMCPASKNTPSIMTVHDLYYEMAPQLYPMRHRLWWKLFFGQAARRATFLACVSGNTARDVEGLHPGVVGRTRVVPGAGVLPRGAQALPAVAQGEPYVLLLGNVTPNKNVGFVVEALRLLARRGQKVRALHVGRDLTGDLARALAGDGGALLHSLGGLDDGALDAVLRHARALIQPSRYEGFGLPIIEAQERGVPVVASDIPVFREVAGDGGLFVPLDDVEAMAQALFAIINDGPLRAGLSVEALANSARFTFDNSAAAAAAMILEARGLRSAANAAP